MSIGDRIKARRIELGLTVDQIAEKIGKNRATVYRYESNDIEKFTIDVLYPLAEVLRTTPAYLMGWTDSHTLMHDTASEQIAPLKNRNLIRIAARDGSYEERILSDQQLAALKAVLDQMPDASDDL